MPFFKDINFSRLFRQNDVTKILRRKNSFLKAAPNSEEKSFFSWYPIIVTFRKTSMHHKVTEERMAITGCKGR